jgi:Tfp pilus assembly protein FimT
VKTTVRGGDRAAASRHSERGLSSIELLLVLTAVMALTCLALPVTAQAVDSTRGRQAAGFAASRLRLVRQQAVFRTRSVAAVFDQVAGRWQFRICEDRNTNGVRRAEIASGTDVCVEGPYDLEQMFRDVQVAVDPLLHGPEGSTASPDPVRFGPSDMASCSMAGSCTPGTLYLRTTRGRQYAVRLGNVSGRTRVLRYDEGTATWIAG